MVGLLAGCESGPTTPAPVVMKGGGPAVWQDAGPLSSPAPPQHALALSGPHRKVVRSGESSGHLPPAIIPLDGPRSAAAASPPVAAATPEPPARPALQGSSAPRAGDEPDAAAEARAEAAGNSAKHGASGGQFAWPVRGHILAGYGVAAGGAHNDGINIAAARGTPITAIEGGTVAYAGNELRGYGNLVLIKHGKDWISAYAHCDELLVKRGDVVRRGQAIARVGATGGVSEPQLHFELRRGKRAVDPREYLAPLPSAANSGDASKG